MAYRRVKRKYVRRRKTINRRRVRSIRARRVKKPLIKLQRLIKKFRGVRVGKIRSGPTNRMFRPKVTIRDPYRTPINRRHYPRSPYTRMRQLARLFS